ncbi:MAG: LysM peptidoglycan-binding domain-containing protein [Kiritimatiellia bacterium]
MKRKAKIMMSAMLGGVVLASGCAAIGARIVDNKPFAGVRCHYEMWFERASISEESRIPVPLLPLSLVDLPFSLVFDVCYVPFESRTNAGPRAASQKAFICYTAKSNDDIYSVAICYGVSPFEIMELNNLTNSALSVGQLVKVPGLRKASTEGANEPSVAQPDR